MFGTAWDITLYSNQDTTIRLVKGDEVKYDAATKMLTYPEGSRLAFDFEFLPAQGKNETSGSAIDLDTMNKYIL